MCFCLPSGAETGASPLLARKAAVVTRGGLRTRASLAVAAAAGGGAGAAAGTVGTRGRAAVARKALGPAAQPVVLTPRYHANASPTPFIINQPTSLNLLFSWHVGIDSAQRLQNFNDVLRK